MAWFWSWLAEDLGVRALTTVLITPLTLVVWKLSEALWHRWYRRRLRKQADVHAARHGTRQVALALSVGDDIAESVRGHLKEAGLLGSGADVPLLCVHQAEGFGASEGQWYAFLESVKAQVRAVRELGCTRVLVYARLPVAQALMVGATLTNGPAAVIYHYNGGRYDAVGQVTFETAKL